MKTTIDTSRTDEYLAKVKARTAQIENFITSRLSILKANETKLNAFAAKFKATDLNLGNMYSTHIGENEYTEAASLLINASLVIHPMPANHNLLAKKLNTEFSKMFDGTDLVAVFNDWQIKGSIVNFKMWIN